jgi:hypothetical protein
MTDDLALGDVLGRIGKRDERLPQHWVNPPATAQRGTFQATQGEQELSRRASKAARTEVDGVADRETDVREGKPPVSQRS